MNAAELRSLIHRTPFAPFTLVLDNGARVRVEDGDHAAVHPFHDVLYLFTPTQTYYVRIGAISIIDDEEWAKGGAK